ncbi:MAG: hypothetical protein IJ744_01075 [Lachnospiraceae bacterium]|nr:hypothetical protein [Lachnospiraceae bacterium]
MNDTMYYQRNINSLPLNDLIWTVFRKWRLILLSMLVFGLFLGGFRGVKEYKSYIDPEAEVERETNYSNELAAYERSKSAYETRIDNLQAWIERLELYKEKSLLLIMDPYDIYKSSVSYFVDTDYEIMPNVFFQNPNYTETLIKSYKLAIERIDYNKLIDLPKGQDLIDTHPVNNQASKKIYSIATDASTGLIQITVISDSKERADKVMNEIKAVMQEQKELLTQAIGEHDLVLLNEGSERTVDLEVASLQKTFATDYETNVAEIEKLEKELGELKEPQLVTVGRGSIIKATIKYGILGCIIGVMIAVLFNMVIYFLNDRMYSVEDLRHRYGLPVLGIIKSNEKKPNKLDLFIESKLGIPVTKPEGEMSYQYIASNVKLYLKGADHVTLIGTTSDTKLHEISERLSKETDGFVVQVGGNVNSQPDAVKALCENTAVVCVEEWQKAKHMDIIHELYAIEASNNQGIGFIVVS